MSQDVTDAIAFKHSTPEAEQTFIVSWCFFNLCNYDCSYCPPSLKNGSLKGLPLETVKEIVDELLALHPQKKFLFEFTGGEVTLYRDFTAMVTYLRKRNCDISILSNGSRPTTWWQQHAPLLNHICLSFHLERASADHFIEVLEVLAPSTTAHVNIMVMPTRLSDALAFSERVKERFPAVTLALQPIVGHPDVTLDAYSAKELFILQTQQADFGPGHLFSKLHSTYRSDMQWHFEDGKTRKTTGPEVITAQTNNWQGWNCSAGLEMLIISWQGDVHRAWCKVGGKIGNIYERPVAWPQDKVLCTQTSCHHGLDILSTKERRE